ncbi:MAG: hypothetical protein Q7T60_17020 [Sphingopyxis sp.]|nr:hypothetical protein [Sphingopyxis sp.]
MKESQIQAAVISHWKAFGLPNTLVAAVPNAGAFRQPGLKRGLFDLVVMGGDYLQGRTGWLELKTAKGILGPHQIEFKELCIANGIPYAVAIGRDEPITVLELWKVVRPSPNLLTARAA